jgi:cobalt-zinc-cadmium efflux system outer membrane protein
MPLPRALGGDVAVYRSGAFQDADDYPATTRAPAVPPPGMSPARRGEHAGTVDKANSDARRDPGGERESAVMTLEKSVALALIHHPSLASFAWQVRAREGSRLQAGLLPNPGILFELENFGGSGQVNGFEQTEATVWFSQAVQLGGKRRKRTDLAALQVELAGWDFETARLDVLTQTRQRYIDVLAARKRLALAEATHALAVEVETSVAKRIESGQSSSADLGKAEVARVSAHIDHAQAAAALARARARLAEMWGGAGPAAFEVHGELPAVSPLPSFSVLAENLDNAPEIARWETEIPAREAALRVAEAAAIPDLQLSAGFRRFEATGDRALVFSSSFPLPVINRNQGAVDAARSLVARALADRRRASTAQRAALAAAHARALASAETVRSLERDSLPSARRAFGSVSDGYRRGRFTYLDVLDAQRTLYAVQARLVDALAGNARDRYAVERLIAIPVGDVGGES